MAVNINTVYQKVLSLSNKEQRGYITPQEFNLFADQAQKEIFEQYFYDINQFNRLPGNSQEYSDMMDNLNEKISTFEEISNVNIVMGGGVVLANDLYRLGTVMYNNTVEIEQVQQNKILYLNDSPLTKPTIDRPVYVRQADISGNANIRVYPPSIASLVTCTYIRIPTTPQWGYFVVGDKPLYDSSPTKTTHFELHPSEESELVYKILKYSGVSIKRDELLSVGQGLESQQVQQEKQ